MSDLKKLGVVSLSLLVIALNNFTPRVQAFGGETLKPVSGRPVSLDGMTPADVLARAELLGGELDAIRFEMGIPRDSRTLAKAENAAPHEVYFQAITLYLKANRLALELTGSTGIQPEGVSPMAVRPYHIWEMVNAAYDRVLTVKKELGISRTIAEAPADPSTTPTDVGYAIVRVNRQINLMLQRRFTPSDAFQQVTLAIRYAARLLKQFPGAKPMPSAPPLERGKQPADVFLRLAECYKRLEALARHSGLQVLLLDTSAAKGAQVFASDVYDIATLLVSDLAYLHGHLKAANTPKTVPYPGRKFPSHVYQQAGVLLAQLTELERRVQADPRWLTR